jgi:hypothetical protein
MFARRSVPSGSRRFQKQYSACRLTRGRLTPDGGLPAGRPTDGPELRSQPCPHCRHSNHEMLHDLRMTAMRKPQRGVGAVGERQVWAVHVGRGEIVWQDRCDAANGSKEPIIPPGAWKVFAHAEKRAR